MDYIEFVFGTILGASLAVPVVAYAALRSIDSCERLLMAQQIRHSEQVRKLWLDACNSMAGHVQP